MSGGGGGKTGRRGTEWIAEEERERVEAEQVAEGQRNTTDAGREGSEEADTAAGVVEPRRDLEGRRSQAT